MVYIEVLVWKEDNNVIDKSDDNEVVKYQVEDVSLCGVFGWLIGQKYCFVNGEEFFIKVYFDYDCKERNF